MKPIAKRHAILISLLVHAALLGGLGYWYLPSVNPTSHSGQPSADGLGSSDDASNDGPIAEQIPSADEPIQADVSDAAIRNSVASQINAVETITDASKLTELEKNLRRLESISSDVSVQEISASIAHSLGLDADQYAPKATAVTGPLDADTAQLLEVLRVADPQGNWQYETVMIDAQGHQMRVPMDTESGAKMYQTFELLQRYPLAKGVYQSVVMPMIQKLLEQPSDR